MPNLKKIVGIVALMVVSLGLIGCGEKKEKVSIKGSDTLVNLAQKWVEVYGAEHKDVAFEVGGGGSGVGIKGMMNGTVKMATASRAVKPKEAEAIKKKFGKDAMPHVVALDALAIYVHKDNPLNEISIDQLKGIYGKDRTITKWSQLGVTVKPDEISLWNRQNSSGTYAYFQKTVLGKNGEFTLDAKSASGSKEIVEAIETDISALGYSGMGYKTDGVKWLKVKKTADSPAVEPSEKTAQDKSYPVSRPLRIYTIGEPVGASKAFLDWVKSSGGQKIVKEMGYVRIGSDKKPS